LDLSWFRVIRMMFHTWPLSDISWIVRRVLYLTDVCALSVTNNFNFSCFCNFTTYWEAMYETSYVWLGIMIGPKRNTIILTSDIHTYNKVIHASSGWSLKFYFKTFRLVVLVTLQPNRRQIWSENLYWMIFTLPWKRVLKRQHQQCSAMLCSSPMPSPQFIIFSSVMAEGVNRIILHFKKEFI
jgi:hypothetical protein